MITATASAPVNIAVVKYWGKRNTKLILPTNDSLSVTLDQDHLRSLTTSATDQSFEAGDRLWLNGVAEEIQEGGRLATCIGHLRHMRKELESRHHALPKISSLPLRICSENNFPTAAGLASSASGFAALVASLAALYQLRPGVSKDDEVSASDLSRIARQGSGSACRSLFGGYVAWNMGDPAHDAVEAKAGEDSIAEEVAPASHWPQMHALICVVSDAKKGTPSTAGMQRTVATSPLLQHRIREVVPRRMAQMREAIASRDFDAFADATMQDSNNFHACCLDTSPPIFYMNDVSRQLVGLVEELNRAALEQGRGRIAAYTYDAGPNAVIYTLEENVRLVVGLVRHYFPDADFEDTFDLLGAGARHVHTASASDPSAPSPLPTGLPHGFNAFVLGGGGGSGSGAAPPPEVGSPEAEAMRQAAGVQPSGSVRRLIHTRVGDGPRVLHSSHLATSDAAAAAGQQHAGGGGGAGAEEVCLLKSDGTPKRLQRAKRA